jgi:hypothetical protein
MKNVQEYLNRQGYNLKVDGIIGKDTINAANKWVQNYFSFNKWIWTPKALVYVRTDNKLTNSYDDFLLFIRNEKVELIVPCSTTAGKFYVQNPLTSGGITGTAIAVPGQYLWTHKFVTSSNWKSLWLGMPYFQQIKAIDIYRDGNKDTNLDTKVKTNGIFGINLHRGGFGSFIDRWSAGCQVVPDSYWQKIIPYYTNGEIIHFNLIG